MTRHSLPTRKLADRKDLQHLQQQAQDLLERFRIGASEAVAEVTTHHPEVDPNAFALDDARLLLPRAYGFESWSRLEAYVEGATDEQLVAAVRARDVAHVRAMVRPAPSCPAEAARCTSR